jgi:hypothetical protein
VGEALVADVGQAENSWAGFVIRVIAEENIKCGINNPFEENCCIILPVTIELSGPLGDTNTETSPSWMKSYLKPLEKMIYPEPSKRGL